MADPLAFKITMGLPKPETAVETNEQLSSIEGMRRAILRGQRDSGLINQCLRAAEYQGLKGEDIYTLIAYYALRMLEDIWQQHSDAMARIPTPPVILKGERNAD